MSFLAPTNPILLELSGEQLLKQCVCQKHFDKTQFDEEGKRIRFSYTCLFTENGIALGEPLSKVEQNEDDTPEMTLVIGRAGSAYELQEVNIDGCGWSLPCYVTLGEEVPVQVRFFADFSSTLLDQNVVININLISLSTDVTPDPCVTVDCPVRTDAVNAFVSVMSVPSRMALNQRGYLRWRVYNERKQLVLCYSVMVQTQSRSQKALREILSKVTPAHANEIVDKIYVETTATNFEVNYIQQLFNTFYASRSEDAMTDGKISEDSASDSKISQDPIFEDIRSQELTSEDKISQDPASVNKKSHNPISVDKKNQGPTLEGKR